MAAEQRKLLEQLMGSDALDARAPKRERINLYDPDICKSFLVDVCLHDILSGTKQDLGRCPRLHLEKHKLEYISQKNKGKEFPEFDIEHERTLEKYIVDLNIRIDSANKRLEKTPEDIAKISQATRDLEEINTSITIGLQEIELLGESGEITRALYELKQLESLRSQKVAKEQEIKNLSEISGFSGFQKLQVCETCAAFLSRLDNDKRLVDHFLGKMHRGYVQLRNSYEEIKEKNAQRRKQDIRKRSYMH